MRNRYTKEFECFVRENVSKYTKEDFILLLENKFNIKLSKEALRRYLSRHDIKERYVDYQKNKVKNVYKCPVGTERITSEGVFVKIAQPNKWKRKSKNIFSERNSIFTQQQNF